jgi:anti-sigma-K factor RskA
VDVHELTAGYALDALDPDERKRYEQHLGTCASCQAELAELGEVAGALAYGADGPAPAPELRARILDAAAGDNVVALTRRRTWAVPAVAVAACVAVALAVWAVSLSRSLSDERDARADLSRALTVLADPQATRAEVAGAAGTVAVDRSGRGVLVVRGLGAAPAGKTYEAWVITKAGARAAGLFRGGGSTTVVPLAAVPPGAVIAATVERAGGVAQSRMKPVFTAKLS